MSQWYADHALNLITYLPLLGALALLFVDNKKKGLIVHAATWIALADFLLSVPLFFMYDADLVGFQFQNKASWIPSIGVQYYVGIDGISLLLLLLTTFLGFISILSSWTAITERVKEYYIFMLLLQTGMLGVFVSLDFFLFYVFWEVMLVPMYFLIGIWGGPRKLYAAIKFFLYTLFGSALMLIGILALYFFHASLHGAGAFAPCPYPGPHDAYTFDITVMHALGSLPYAGAWQSLSYWVFLAFFVGFAIKVPMFPFHTWLPDAHVEAPTAGSVLLAGVLLKMGTYGFLRFALPLFPTVALHPAVQRVIVTLAVIGILYGGLVAMVQPDFKKLIAYSSVAHLGFVMLGIWALTLQSVQGALLVMINHGISTGALFFLVGMIYERRHSRLIEAYGGIARVVPLFAVILTIVSLSSIALPGTNGFVGEFLVLIGSFRTYPIATAVATSGVIIAAAYLLTALQRVIYNPLTQHENEKLTDLTPREIAVLVPLIVCILWIGIYPKPFLQRMEPAARALIEQIKPAPPPVAGGGQP